MYMIQPAAFLVCTFGYFLTFQLVFGKLKFPEGTSSIWQVCTVFILTVMIIILISIPLYVFLNTKGHNNLLSKTLTVTGLMFLILFYSAVLLRVIPVVILDMTLRSAGIIDLKTHNYMVPSNNYPSEYFGKSKWNLKKHQIGSFIFFMA